VVAVHQFVPSFAPRDAIGGHARHIQQALADAGFESKMFVGEAREVGRTVVEDYRSFAGGRGPTWLLYQLSTGSRMAEFLQARPEPRIVDYHNVTPPAFFAHWEPVVARELAAGRNQMEELAAGTALGLADSAFNRAELDDAGYARTAVLPILLDLSQFETAVDQRRLDQLRTAKAGGGADLLFVGRISPNKCQHDLIKALAVYRRLYDPRARLHLVGGSSSHAYWTALHRYAEHLELGGSIHLHGSVSPGALAAHYRAADAFVCLSEHEGFCVPLLEAWHHRLPVVAFAAAAVPETVAGGGLVLPNKDPVTVAAAMHRVLSDARLRELLVAAGLARLGDFDLERTRKILVAAVEELVAGGSQSWRPR
jgi:glycosyltransferase involved in cell wall biosynthesis